MNPCDLGDWAWLALCSPCVSWAAVLAPFSSFSLGPFGARGKRGRGWRDSP